MADTNIILDELETEVTLYRYSLMREDPSISKEQLRNKVNKKFKEKNKNVLSEIMNSHLNLLDSKHIPTK